MNVARSLSECPARGIAPGAIGGLAAVVLDLHRFLVCLHAGVGCSGAFCGRDRVPDGPCDEVEIAHVRDPGLARDALLAREQLVEQSARIGDPDEHRLFR